MEHHHASLFADPRSWVGIAFIIFFVIFGRKLWGVLTAILDKRAETIRSELDEAARLRREAEAMLADAKAQRVAARRDAEAMIARAHEEAARVAEVARADAFAAATRRERTAMDRIAAAEKAAVTDVQLAAATIAARAAGDVIEHTFDATADAPLIDRAISGLSVALSDRRAA